MKPTMLFRHNSDSHDEYLVAKQYFDLYRNRTAIPVGTKLVIARLSALPMYHELVSDLKVLNATLINSLEQHEWIAKMYWLGPLRELTFRTWDDSEYPQCGYDGPVVLKGKTNSRKWNWNKLMYAASREDTRQIYRRLYEDPEIAQQGIVYREYVPLKTLEIGINGLPFVNEWRFFFVKEQLIGHSFNFSEICDCPEKAELTQDGIDLAMKVAKIAAEYTTFFAVDVAQKADGGWIMVEINDGQMSGLSGLDPSVFYPKLAQVME